MFSAISGDYFRALQIPLLSGRTFEPRDNADAPKVVIVNETIAKRHFGSVAGAIGKRLSIWRDEKFMREIVGVVGDTKTGSLTGEGGSQIYVPHAQDSHWNFMGLVIRTAGDPAAFTTTLRREVQVTVIGVVVGIAGAFVLTRLIANLLFGVATTDPLTFIAIPLLLLLVALVACYLPARRAARLNPKIALAQN